MKDWKFFTPDFVFKKDIIEYTWSGHLNFIYDLVRNIKPGTFVELGTYKGTSAMGISQGVLDEELNTKLFFVDCWEGDEHSGFYGEEIYQEFLKTKEKYFSKLKINTLKMYFDEALPKFEDKSIDILHIDGLHTYEGVKHDYDTWKSKVSDTGVIVFHDIRVQHFGVKELWAEIKTNNPEYTYLEFDHNYGLGILFKDKSIKEILTKEKLKEIYEYYSLISTEYQLRQRIVELQNEKEEVLKEKNSVLGEVELLKKQKNDIEQENTSLKNKYNRKLIRFVLRFYDLINRQ